MVWLMAYLVVAVMMVQLDGLSCYVDKRYFNLKGSMLAASLWFITIPIVIWQVYKECKKYEKRAI